MINPRKYWEAHDLYRRAIEPYQREIMRIVNTVIPSYRIIVHPGGRMELLPPVYPAPYDELLAFLRGQIEECGRRIFKPGYADYDDADAC